MNNAIALTADMLRTMTAAEVDAALGFAPGVKAHAAKTVASRRRGSSADVAPAADTGVCVVLISAEHNPLI